MMSDCIACDNEEDFGSACGAEHICGKVCHECQENPCACDEIDQELAEDAI